MVPKNTDCAWFSKPLSRGRFLKRFGAVAVFPVAADDWAVNDIAVDHEPTFLDTRCKGRRLLRDAIG